jgi:hypothetical protein
VNYYYIPQNAWGLVDASEEQNTGFYSQPGGPCSPVAIWCQATARAAYTHFDGNAQAVDAALADWLADSAAQNGLSVHGCHQPHLDEIKAQLEAAFHGAQVTTLCDDPGQYWGFMIDTDAGQPVWVDEMTLPDEDLFPLPDAWRGYWAGAPDWANGPTFTSAISAALTGFIANYNGRFYFDFG